MTDVQVGDRIELVEMGKEKDGREDPSPMEPGATGTVLAVTGMTWFEERSLHVSVDWDVEWPEGTVTCPTCGQPDNCGDCNHQPLSFDEVRSLGGSKRSLSLVCPPDRYRIIERVMD